MSRYTTAEPGLAEFFIIAVAVFVGGLLAMLAHDEITAYRIKTAAAQAAQHLQKEIAQQKQKEQQRQQAIQQQQQEQQRRQQEQAQVRAQQAAAERARQQRKQKAWEQFYQPSGICKNDSARGDCADQHIRARTVFEAQYKDPYD